MKISMRNTTTMIPTSRGKERRRRIISSRPGRSGRRSDSYESSRGGSSHRRLGRISSTSFLLLSFPSSSRSMYLGLMKLSIRKHIKWKSTCWEWSIARSSPKKLKEASSQVWFLSFLMWFATAARNAQTSIFVEILCWTWSLKTRIKTKKLQDGNARLVGQDWTSSTSKDGCLTWPTEDWSHIRCKIWNASNAPWSRTPSWAGTASAPVPTSRPSATSNPRSWRIRTSSTRWQTSSSSCSWWETSPTTTASQSWETQPNRSSNCSTEFQIDENYKV